MSGYGVTQEYEDGSRSYSPLQSSSTWMSLAYKYKDIYNFAIFGGYMKNMGSNDSFTALDDLYVRGSTNIDQIFRVTPSIMFTPSFGRRGVQRLEAGVEYELTGVYYGTPNNYCRVHDSTLTMNNRVTVILVNNFGY